MNKTLTANSLSKVCISSVVAIHFHSFAEFEAAYLAAKCAGKIIDQVLHDQSHFAAFCFGSRDVDLYSPSLTEAEECRVRELFGQPVVETVVDLELIAMEPVAVEAATWM